MTVLQRKSIKESNTIPQINGTGLYSQVGHTLGRPVWVQQGDTGHRLGLRTVCVWGGGGTA